MDKNIEIRKIVPIAAKISSGKSTLLNVLYNINFLDCNAGITTKFVNLIRYNPEINKPIFYHLKLEKKGEKYIFYKDLNELYEGEKDIKEANININKKLYEKREIDYENIFYMTEIKESPFIKDKNYLLTHDICDMPGLSEYQQNQNEKEKNINGKFNKIDNNNENKVKINDEEGKFEDDIYYKVDMENKKYLTEIFKIIKNYMDGGILILNVENYYHEDNFELIVKLHKVIEKDIANFLVILNKIDLSENPEKDIEKCKGEIIKYFPKCQTFNINFNTFIPLSIIQVQNELLMKNSFKHLIYYHFYNFLSKINRNEQQDNSTFINHLIKIIRVYDDEIRAKDIESKVKELDNSNNISEINNEIKLIINFLEEKCQGKGINLGISEKDISDNDENDFEKELKKKKSNKIESLNPSYIIKLFYIYYKEKKLIPELSEETNNLLNYFKNEKHEFNYNKNINERETNRRTELNKKMKNLFLLLINEMKKSKIDIKQINSIIGVINDTIEFLKISDIIFIPFLGNSNVGKTTILNGIIGKNILPTSLEECTKRGVIIRYCNIGEEETTIRKVNFIEEKYLDKSNIYLQNGYIIARGEKQVNEFLKSLNYEYPHKEEDYFYYIRTKIKLFDDLKLDENLKRIIYLVDFPGYGTNSKFMEKEICKKIIAKSSSFIFTIRNSLIKDNNTKKILMSMFNDAKTLNNKLGDGIINYCLFILNNDNSQTTTEEDLKKAKNDIQEIVNVNGTDDINLCFFNAKYFSEYCQIYNYFFNIKETINLEYKNYLSNQNIIYKSPENFYESYSDFFEYLIKKLYNKIKKDLSREMSKLKIEKIKENKNIEFEIHKIFTKYTQLEYIKMDQVFTKENLIIKVFSFGQENINNLKILKESNIDKFKILLNSHINYINNNLKVELNKKIDDIISLLDKLFESDTSNKENKIEDINKIKEFKQDIINNKLKIIDESNINKDKILTIFSKFENDIYTSLKEKKHNIQKSLENCTYTDIINEIKYKIEEQTIDLNDKIDDFMDNCFPKINELFKDAGKKIEMLSEGKVKLTRLDNFKDFLTIKIGNKNKNLYQQIYKELDFNKDLYLIFNEINFIEGIKSSVSDYYYLVNYIDILTKELKKNLIMFYYY